MRYEQPERGRTLLPAVAPGGAVVGAICAVGVTTYAGARAGSSIEQLNNRPPAASERHDAVNMAVSDR